MSKLSRQKRFLFAEPLPHLQRPKARLQPFLAKPGEPSVDLYDLEDRIKSVTEVNPMIVVESPEQWANAVRGLGPEVDGILPFSIPAYPTEIWNSHPQPLVDRQLPFIFWCLLEHQEPDFWRWSAKDFLTALGVNVQLVQNDTEGLALLKALAMKRFLQKSKLVVFGEQNFPWNATAAGHLVTEKLSTEIVVRPMRDIREQYPDISDDAVEAVLAERLGDRYVVAGVLPEELEQAVRTYLAIKNILEEEKALGFGVNCFGDLIPNGDRDVPCLAQCLLREDGYIAACDGDYIAMMSMVLSTFYLDKTVMMSNMYPVSYVGALTDHFGNPLSPDKKRYPRETWHNLARLAHCGFIGVVSPEMTPGGQVTLSDWGGTYEIKRDGSGCGIDAEMPHETEITVVELCFDAQRFLIARGRVCETTRHAGMPHCETSALLEFRNLPEFVKNISREHTVVVYGNYVREFEILADVLQLKSFIF